MIHLVGRRRRREKISLFLHVFILRFEPSLTGIFNRKSFWLKRKPRSVLEDGLGVELNKPVGRSTRTRCRLPGNDVWKRKNGVKSLPETKTRVKSWRKRRREETRWCLKMHKVTPCRSIRGSHLNLRRLLRIEHSWIYLEESFMCGQLRRCVDQGAVSQNRGQLSGVLAELNTASASLRVNLGSLSRSDCRPSPRSDPLCCCCLWVGSGSGVSSVLILLQDCNLQLFDLINQSVVCQHPDHNPYFIFSFWNTTETDK